MFLVQEKFKQAHFETPTLRHYQVQADSPEQAVELVRNSRVVRDGIVYGCVPGSEVSVIM